MPLPSGGALLRADGGARKAHRAHLEGGQSPVKKCPARGVARPSQAVHPASLGNGACLHIPALRHAASFKCQCLSGG